MRKELRTRNALLKSHDLNADAVGRRVTFKHFPALLQRSVRLINHILRDELPIPLNVLIVAVIAQFQIAGLDEGRLAVSWRG